MLEHFLSREGVSDLSLPLSPFLMCVCISFLVQLNKAFQEEESPVVIYCISMHWFREWEAFVKGKDNGQCAWHDGDDDDDDVQKYAQNQKLLCSSFTLTLFPLRNFI